MNRQAPDLFWPAGHRDAEEAVKQAELTLVTLRAKLAEQKKLAIIMCARCEAKHPVATQEYVQTFWYTSPHGCTGGDYWNMGEANWHCPSCGFCNRFDAEKDKHQSLPNAFYRPEIVAIKDMFGSRRECHCDYRQQCHACKTAKEARNAR